MIDLAALKAELASDPVGMGYGVAPVPVDPLALTADERTALTAWKEAVVATLNDETQRAIPVVPAEEDVFGYCDAGAFWGRIEYVASFQYLGGSDGVTALEAEYQQQLDALATAINTGPPVPPTPTTANKLARSALQGALQASARRRRALNPLDVNAPAFQALLSIFQGMGIITQQNVDDLTALGTRTGSRADELGWGRVRVGDIERARAL